jgi:glucokinase
MSEKTYIGVDIGGTKIAAGLVKGFKVIKRHIEPTSVKDGASLIRQVEVVVERLWTGQVSAIGVGIAGLTDHSAGVFLGGPNLPHKLAKTRISWLLQKRFKVPATIDNDVHCFTLAEAKIGAGKRFSSVVGINLGTGVGGGIVINGQLYRGRNNGAGEFGHSLIGSSAKCGCGQKGHFEALASGSAMKRLYRKISGRSANATEVELLAKKGDRDAKKIFSVMADALGAGLANIILTVNPDVIVVGGGLAKVDMLMKPAIRLTASKIIYAPLRSTPIVRAKLGGDANLIGAAILAAEASSKK